MISRVLERFGVFMASNEGRRKRWPVTPRLQEKHIQNCRLITDRVAMLEHLPKGGVCAEVGIFKCDFSEQILSVLQPEKLHLIDIDPASIEIAGRRFQKEIGEGRAEIHHGDSSSILARFPDQSLDWVYIDGDHNYPGVKKDLEQARVKVKEGGLISLNDYIYFGTTGLAKYGVIEAVNEFCLTYDYELIMMALHGRMYNDVTLRKIR